MANEVNNDPQERGGRRKRLFLITGIAIALVIGAWVFHVQGGTSEPTAQVSEAISPQEEHVSPPPVERTPEEIQRDGEKIDYNELYVQAMSSGLTIGKRYSFRAAIYSNLEILSPEARYTGIPKSLQGRADFDDPENYRSFLRSSIHGNHIVVASMSQSGLLMVHKVD